MTTQQNTKGVELANRYDALNQLENQEEGFTILLMDAIKPPSKNKLKKEKRRQLCSGFQDSHCSSSSSCLGCDDDKKRNVKNLPSSGLQGASWEEEELEKKLPSSGLPA